MGRGLIVVVAALLLAVQVVRNSAVAALAQADPARASRIWSDHPDVEIALGMTEIGRATHDRRAPPRSAFAAIDDAARKAPLAPEPFLVRGVQAQVAGNGRLAMQAFSSAERRDPRSLPAHYFLADALFRSGDARRGLEEVGLLARLAPNGIASVAPYVAAYAKDRSNWPQLRNLFRSNPELENSALVALAADPANADLVMALVDPKHRRPDSGWLSTLLARLVEVGQYDKARAVWASGAGIRQARAEVLHDAGFVDPSAPAPLNWELRSSTVGLAERQKGGRLHVIYYGQEDGLLARQMLLLSPGRYRMTLALQGTVVPGNAPTWSIRCDRTQSPVAALPIDAIARSGWTFTVPAGCPAQWLELSGVSSDMARQSDFSIGRLRLTAEGAGG